MSFNPIAFARRTWALHGPSIVTGLGMALELGGTIWACLASIKVHDYLEERDSEELGLFAGTDDADDLKKGKAVVRRRLDDAIEIGKQFIGPVACVGGGMLLIAKGHGMVLDKLGLVASAYAACASSYSTYREGVRQEYGEVVDQMFAHGLKPTGETVSVESDDGAKISVPEATRIITDEDEQIATLAKLGYSADELLKENVEIRWNRETAPTQWSHDKAVNLMFLSGAEAMMNREAYRDHMITVWDMADKLGIPAHLREPEWQIMVWYPTPTEMANAERDNEPIKLFEIGIFDPCNDIFLDTGYRDVDTNECWLSLPVRGLLLPGAFPFGEGDYLAGSGRFRAVPQGS